MQTTVTELPESRVRVEAEVSPEEVERSLEQAAKALGKDLRMPGFRRGKIPMPVVIKRFGREAVLDQAVRGSLGRWYVDALEDSKIHPVGDPDPDLADVDAELEQLRERGARLETVEEPAQRGDFVVMDYVGSIDGEEFEGG